MMGTKKLSDGLETGVAAVRKADDSLRIVMALTAACLIISMFTLAVVAVRDTRA